MKTWPPVVHRFVLPWPVFSYVLATASRQTYARPSRRSEGEEDVYISSFLSSSPWSGSRASYVFLALISGTYHIFTNGLFYPEIIARVYRFTNPGVSEAWWWSLDDINAQPLLLDSVLAVSVS